MDLDGMGREYGSLSMTIGGLVKSSKSSIAKGKSG